MDPESPVIWGDLEMELELSHKGMLSSSRAIWNAKASHIFIWSLVSVQLNAEKNERCFKHCVILNIYLKSQAKHAQKLLIWQQ